jgi:hypothetical protein
MTAHIYRLLIKRIQGHLPARAPIAPSQSQSKPGLAVKHNPALCGKQRRNGASNPVLPTDKSDRERPISIAGHCDGLEQSHVSPLPFPLKPVRMGMQNGRPSFKTASATCGNISAASQSRIPWQPNESRNVQQFG